MYTVHDIINIIQKKKEKGDIIMIFGAMNTGLGMPPPPSNILPFDKWVVL